MSDDVLVLDGEQCLCAERYIGLGGRVVVIIKEINVYKHRTGAWCEVARLTPEQIRRIGAWLSERGD